MAPHPRTVPALYAPRVLARDFARSWRFYRDVLGLVPAPGHGGPPYGEFVERKRVALAVFDRELMEAATGRALAPGRARSGSVLLGFEVPDVDRFAARLRRRRVRLLRGPTDRPEWGLRTVHLLDPDENLVEIFHRIPMR